MNLFGPSYANPFLAPHTLANKQISDQQKAGVIVPIPKPCSQIKLDPILLEFGNPKEFDLFASDLKSDDQNDDEIDFSDEEIWNYNKEHFEFHNQNTQIYNKIQDIELNPTNQKLSFGQTPNIHENILNDKKCMPFGSFYNKKSKADKLVKKIPKKFYSTHKILKDYLDPIHQSEYQKLSQIFTEDDQIKLKGAQKNCFFLEVNKNQSSKNPNIFNNSTISQVKQNAKQNKITSIFANYKPLFAYQSSNNELFSTSLFNQKVPKQNDKPINESSMFWNKHQNLKPKIQKETQNQNPNTKCQSISGQNLLKPPSKQTSKPEFKQKSSSFDLIDVNQKPTSKQEFFLPIFQIPKTNYKTEQISDESIKTDKKVTKSLAEQEKEQLEMLRLKVKELQLQNNQYLKVIVDLSKTVKNLSIGMMEKSKNEQKSKKYKGQKELYAEEIKINSIFGEKKNKQPKAKNPFLQK